MISRKKGFYEKYIKRILDVICALLAMICFSWLFIFLVILVRIKLGKHVIFKQARPGMIGKDGKEKIFYLYKFRTMTDAKDEKGNPLPDDERMTAFGVKLRSTGLDEIPEAFNILKGDMSVIGPRPQLVRDLVFMSDEVRVRHTAKPGLSGLAQVMGSSRLTWEDKFKWDLEYIQHITFWGDMKLVWQTVEKAFFRKRGGHIGEISDDYGDALLKSGKITAEEYEQKQDLARQILEQNG